MPANQTRGPAICFNDLALQLGAVGLGVYTKRLIALLGKADIPLRLLSEEPELCRKNVSAPWGLSVLSKLPPVQTAWQNFLLRRELKQIGPQDLFISPLPVACPLPKKSIVIFHDLIPHHFPKYDGRFLYRKWNRERSEYLSSRASRIVAISEFTKREVISRLGIDPQKVTVIPNWVDESFSPHARPGEKEALRKKYQLPESYWMYIGGYDYRKNIEFLLRAYDHARKQTALPPLVLAGRIPKQQKSKPVCQIDQTLEELSEINQSIIRLGFIQDEDLPALYRQAGLLIFPSLMEGFGYTPAEALACGCPAYVADNSALREIVDDPKYRFPTSDLGLLAAKLVAAAAQPPPPNRSAIDLTPKRALAQLMPLLESL